MRNKRPRCSGRLIDPEFSEQIAVINELKQKLHGKRVHRVQGVVCDGDARSGSARWTDMEELLAGNTYVGFVDESCGQVQTFSLFQSSHLDHPSNTKSQSATLMRRAQARVGSRDDSSHLHRYGFRRHHHCDTYALPTIIKQSTSTSTRRYMTDLGDNISATPKLPPALKRQKIGGYPISAGIGVQLYFNAAGGAKCGSRRT